MCVPKRSRNPGKSGLVVLRWLGDSLGISGRGTKAKSITSCDNAFVTNIGAAAATLALRFRAKNICWPKRLIGRSQEALLCAKA